MRLTLQQTQTLQTQLTDYIRDPASARAPRGIEQRRLNIYRDLFFGNVEGFMRRGFPIIHQLFSEQDWQRLIRDFMLNYQCNTPYFTKITEEFVRYLQSERPTVVEEPPFLQELAHYEWVEVALDLADIDLDDVPVDPDGDLLEQCPVVSPLLMSLAYRFPVHRIGPSFQPQEPPEEASYLLVYRNRKDQVQFMEGNAVTARMLALLQAGEGDTTGRRMLGQIADELQHPNPEQVLESGRKTLNKLRSLDIILGTSIRSPD